MAKWWESRAEERDDNPTPTGKGAGDNKDIDVESPQGNDGNSTWWFKADDSNANKNKGKK